MSKLLTSAVVVISTTIATGIDVPLEKLPAFAQQNTSGTVVSVGDGDTIRVKKQNQAITVRLACIDAPEIAQKPWGERSKYRLGQFLPAGQTVRLREIERDRYGRTIAEVFKNDRSINLQMVREGYAVVYRQYLSACSAARNQYLKAEEGAKNNRLAFWSQSSPVLPWDFRAGRTVSQAQPTATPTPTPSPSPVAPATPTVGTPLRAPTEGQGCRCPYDYDARGRVCGGRSAYSRPGGDSPKCYVGD